MPEKTVTVHDVPPNIRKLAEYIHSCKHPDKVMAGLIACIASGKHGEHHAARSLICGGSFGMFLQQ